MKRAITATTIWVTKRLRLTRAVGPVTPEVLVRLELRPLIQLGQGLVVGVELEDEVQDLVVEAAVGEHAGPEMIADGVLEY